MSTTAPSPPEDPDKPASAPDVMPPHVRPDPSEEEAGEGTNAVRHHPDPSADHKPRDGEHKPRGPYVTGNT